MTDPRQGGRRRSPGQEGHLIAIERRLPARVGGRGRLYASRGHEIVADRAEFY